MIEKFCVRCILEKLASKFIPISVAGGVWEEYKQQCELKLISSKQYALFVVDIYQCPQCGLRYEFGPEGEE